MRVEGSHNTPPRDSGKLNTLTCTLSQPVKLVWKYIYPHHNPTPHSNYNITTSLRYIILLWIWFGLSVCVRVLDPYLIYKMCKVKLDNKLELLAIK